MLMMHTKMMMAITMVRITTDDGSEDVPGGGKVLSGDETESSLNRGLAMTRRTYSCVALSAATASSCVTFSRLVSFT